MNQNNIDDQTKYYAPINQQRPQNHPPAAYSQGTPDQSEPQEPWIPPAYQNQARRRRGDKWRQEEVKPQAKGGNNSQLEDRKKRRPLLGLTLTCAVLTLILIGALIGQGLLRGYIQTQEGLKQAAYEQYLKRYPLQYRELIEGEAKKNNLHPAFVAAIILNESSFKKDAQSSVGARGLMQVMEDTAGWIASKLDEGNAFHFDLMYQPEANIRYGAWYLGFLSQRFNGDPILVAGAYHAGQGEVSKWLANKEYSQDGKTISIENMIDGPTKNYVKKVAQAYAAYKSIYYTPTDEKTI